VTEQTEQTEQEAPQPTLQQNIAWYLTLLLITLVACMPCTLCSLYYLSTVPDITWRRGRYDLTVDRIWMARLRGPVGLGYETQRVTRTISADQVCVTNTIRYFLWSDAGEETGGTEFSRLFGKTETGWRATGEGCD